MAYGFGVLGDTCGNVSNVCCVTKCAYGYKAEFYPVSGLNDHAFLIVVSEFSGVYANRYLVNCAVSGHN